MAIYTFSDFPDDKKAEVKKAVRKFGHTPFDHPKLPGQVCFHSAKSREGLLPFRINVASAAQVPDLKLRGPIPEDDLGDPGAADDRDPDPADDLGEPGAADDQGRDDG